MKLDRVLPESEIFIDTNVFLYDITDHPDFGLSTKNFFKNIELGIFQGKTSIIVLNELLHKLVIGEIAEKLWTKIVSGTGFYKARSNHFVKFEVL